MQLKFDNSQHHGCGVREFTGPIKGNKMCSPSATMDHHGTPLECYGGSVESFSLEFSLVCRVQINGLAMKRCMNETPLSKTMWLCRSGFLPSVDLSGNLGETEGERGP